VVAGDMGLSEVRDTLQPLEKSSYPDVAFVAKQQLNRMAQRQ